MKPLFGLKSLSKRAGVTLGCTETNRKREREREHASCVDGSVQQANEKKAPSLVGLLAATVVELGPRASRRFQGQFGVG